METVDCLYEDVSVKEYLAESIRACEERDEEPATTPKSTTPRPTTIPLCGPSVMSVVDGADREICFEEVDSTTYATDDVEYAKFCVNPACQRYVDQLEKAVTVDCALSGNVSIKDSFLVRERECARIVEQPVTTPVATTPVTTPVATTPVPTPDPNGVKTSPPSTSGAPSGVAPTIVTAIIASLPILILA